MISVRSLERSEGDVFDPTKFISSLICTNNVSAKKKILQELVSFFNYFRFCFVGVCRLRYN